MSRKASADSSSTPAAPTEKKQFDFGDFLDALPEAQNEGHDDESDVFFVPSVPAAAANSGVDSDEEEEVKRMQDPRIILRRGAVDEQELAKAAKKLEEEQSQKLKSRSDGNPSSAAKRLKIEGDQQIK